MPEKWEHELRRLRTVEPPAGLEDRVQDGPRFEPGRPRRERVTAAVVAFAVCAAVGVAGFQTLRDDDGPSNVATGVPSSDDTIVLELSSNADGPTATVRYGDLEQQAVFEGANWCPEGGPDTECTSYIADFAFYPPVSEFLVVPPSTPIEIVGPATIAKMHVTDPYGEPIGSAGDAADSAPGEDGMYAFAVSAEWSEGTGDFFFGIQTLGDPANAPDVLTLDCTAFAARLDTAVVRTQPDGLHLRIVGDTNGFAIGVPGQDGTGLPDAAIGGTDQGAVGIDPGRWGIKCGKDSAIGSFLTPFELIDPDDHYAPWELACGDRPGTAFFSSIPATTSHADAAAQLIAGLAPGDRVRGAGYGAETWRLGPTYVVDRAGEAVGRLVLGSQPDPVGGPDAWGGTFATCDGSGLSLADDEMSFTPAPTPTGGTADSSVTGPTPTGTGDVADELVARCEGLGPAIDTPQVRLQGDSLAAEVTNVADAEVIVIEGEDQDVFTPVLIPINDVTQAFSVQMEPGSYWLGCRVRGEDVVVEGDHTTVPDAYVRFEVLPAA